MQQGQGMVNEQPVIGVIGLGYVGLPVAVAFGGRYPTVGFDIDPRRVAGLQAGHDRTREVTDSALQAAKHLSFSDRTEDLRGCNLYVVTVPTPVTPARVPDFGPLEKASRMLGPLLRPGDTVVYESTVYPGATEDVCVPLLEAGSGLAYRRDFHVGYSPERANPGDPDHRLDSIVKVVAASSAEVCDWLADLYGEIVPAGIHKASSIAVAEAAKVIENIQRDINVALVNELAMIFGRLGLDSQEVLAAAGTKWNFLPFTPGLVGGHCIGVDPYYLTYKAQAIGYHPEMILAGRRINDGMGGFIAGELVKLMLQRRIHVNGARVLVMGITFKENTPDIRNTRVVDIVRELEQLNVAVDVHDPWADADEVQAEYGIALVDAPEAEAYDGLIVAVAHREFRAQGSAWVRDRGKPAHVVYDVKHCFPAGETDGRL
ncbi:nucleotide sugar dehydrogenase [Salinisphaera sp. P385]|uniref:Nucleotide sugar dehydrogenase n=1 Tax=Spectribacter acetivorans TaxID=3075603 RepID=A0ABU3BBJ8_9GAMM|nr:nucleotide sugar dehydrogenase [Salinisphaera sp. P385]MDT0619867.1 nucleotide sugar dehydrogenase [Salinisphaera sp. P385]